MKIKNNKKLIKIIVVAATAIAGVVFATNDNTASIIQNILGIVEHSLDAETTGTVTSLGSSGSSTSSPSSGSGTSSSKISELQGLWKMDGDNVSGREIRVYNDNGYRITFAGSFPMPYGYYEYDGKINSYDGSAVSGVQAYGGERRFTFSAKVSGNKFILSNFDGEISNLNFNGTYTRE